MTRPGDSDFAAAWTEAWSSRDPATVSALFSPDGTYVDGGMANTYEGHVGVQRFVRYMLMFSPDSRIDFSDPVVDGDAFTAEWVWSGHAEGDLRVGDRKIVPSGAAYAVEGVAVCRSDAEGRITWHKDYYNVLELVRQVESG